MDHKAYSLGKYLKHVLIQKVFSSLQSTWIREFLKALPSSSDNSEKESHLTSILSDCMWKVWQSWSSLFSIFFSSMGLLQNITAHTEKKKIKNRQAHFHSTFHMQSKRFGEGKKKKGSLSYPPSCFEGAQTWAGTTHNKQRGAVL